MNIFEGRWDQFKQELFSILFLSFLQIWWSFNCPIFVRLGAPLSTIVSTSLSIVGIFLCFLIFVFPEKYVPRINLEWLDDAPNSLLLKEIFKIIMILVFHLGLFYFWYIDFYRMPDIFYAISYVHCVIAFMLMTNALDSYNNRIK